MFKATSMKNPWSGNSVPHQILISYKEHGLYIYQSHGITIAVNDNGRILLDEVHWDRSIVSRKYLQVFLEEPDVVTRRKVSSGMYILEDLN